jgi:NAD(P)-dependent dehydrogenase (short-subunit alcohol dehydrogenase family)
MDFDGKTVVVVGASSGIGERVCVDLVGKGAQVHAWSRHPHPDFEKMGVRFSAVDVSKPIDADLPDVPETVHGLAFLPGTIRLAPFVRLKEEEFVEDFTINVLGAVRVLKLVIRSLAKAGGASAVLVSTVASRIGMNFHASIASAKGAVEGLAKSLAAEYAAKKIRFNVVAPSLTDTPLASFLLNSDEKRKKSDARHPIGRIGSPADIAHAIEFLLSDESSWITGQVFSVDGGMSSVKLF